ncbi:MAG TPA: LysM peptidoglycan-binding domain-containing protein [Pseudobdellovibrionaceae bacterium]|nr:LysM peptidoglycan-binding domain-containing protein [Pseudobdellovibrionaceae bacterium]
MRRLQIFFILVLAVPAFAGWAPYTIRKGDTLSAIGRKFFPERPVWGEAGSVSMLARKNRSRIKNPDRIYTGQRIDVPEKNDESLAGREQIESLERETERIVPVTDRPDSLDQDRRGTFKLGLLFSLWDRMLKDKTTGTSGTLRSKAILGVSMEALFPISKTWSIESGVRLRNIEFSSAANRNIVADSKNYIDFHLGMSRAAESSEIGFGIQYEQLPLVTGVSVSAVGTTSFNVLSPYMHGAWQLHRYGKTKVSLKGRLAAHFPSSSESYKLEKGYLAEISVPLHREISEFASYGLIPFLEYGNRETNTVVHTETGGGIRAEFLWRY